MYKLFPLIFIFSLLLIQASASGGISGVNHYIDFHIKISGKSYSYNMDGTWGLIGYLNVSYGHKNISLMVENISITPVVYMNYSISLNNRVNSINYSLYLISISSVLNSTPIRQNGSINLAGVKDIQIYINKTITLNNDPIYWFKDNLYFISLIIAAVIFLYTGIRIDNHE